MSWRQDYERAPRPRWDVYLDGLVTGLACAWILMMFYDHVVRQAPGNVGPWAFGLCSLAFFAAIVFKVVRLRRDGR